MDRKRCRTNWVFPRYFWESEHGGMEVEVCRERLTDIMVYCITEPLTKTLKLRGHRLADRTGSYCTKKPVRINAE